MFILFFFSVFVGYIFSEAFIGVGSSFFGNSIYVFFNNFSILDAEFNLFFIKYIPLMICLLGIFIFFLFLIYFERIYKYFFSNYSFIILYKFFSRAFLFDLLFVDFFFNNMLKVSYLYIYKYIEKGFFELFLLVYISSFFRRLNRFIKNLNSGLLYNYFFLIIFFFVFLFFIFEILIYFNYFFLIILFGGFFINKL